MRGKSRFSTTPPLILLSHHIKVYSIKPDKCQGQTADQKHTSISYKDFPLSMSQATLGAWALICTGHQSAFVTALASAEAFHLAEVWEEAPSHLFLPSKQMKRASSFLNSRGLEQIKNIGLCKYLASKWNITVQWHRERSQKDSVPTRNTEATELVHWRHGLKCLYTHQVHFVTKWHAYTTILAQRRHYWFIYNSNLSQVMCKIKYKEFSNVY